VPGWGLFMEHIGVVAKVSTLLDVGRRFLPHLMAQMERATRLLATERSLSEQEYGRAEKADFSRTILEACPELLAVSTIQAVT